ncbi:probable aspartyl protease At4g16563 [Magnolia sinica]|uniref:probable aspartyl protease At4g16563 n=1 Tax=Magnolia sinica TaxID=86752 RepID=UPI002659E1B5|nr:probable aspartyl protease At4g16563 [Magnolia sinica]
MSSSFFLVSLLLFLPLISSEITKISLSLHQFPQNSSPDPSQTFTRLAASSLIRAKHLKKPPHSQNALLSNTPLFPHSYGGYSISLNFGTPPQKISLLMDTGSDLVWLPCTNTYVCKNCSFANLPSKIAVFLPKSSSSSKLIGCKNPKCSWIHSQPNCGKCPPTSLANCSQVCPPYFVLYGSGSTAGLLLSETLNFPEKKVTDFAVGCSIFSTGQPAGVAGFGRGNSSLPTQLGLKRFSYCLVSHRLDDTGKSSSLVLDSTGGSDSGKDGLSYTPILKNPTVGSSAFAVYYYVGLRKVTVGGKSVEIPYRYLSQGSDGNGGTIVDSGTTFTFMEGHVFEPVAREFERLVGYYKRAADMEYRTGLRPCFDVSAEKSLKLPQLAFHFKGGADMALPLANYFSYVGNSGTVCLTIVTDGFTGDGFSGGPSIILGNFQQQNFFLEYDLAKERFGFRPQKC